MMGSKRKLGIFRDIVPKCKSFTAVMLIVASALQFASAHNEVVNLMLLYEDPDSVKSFDAAVQYIKSDPDICYSTGEIWKIQSNGTDRSKLIESLCKDIDAAYSKPKGQQPDIIVDFTRSVLPSDAVKLLAKVMPIPTISGSFGHFGDIQSWKDLSENQKNYLIHIVPPAEMLPQAVGSIVSKQGMTNAAYLFDVEYEPLQKNKSSLENMPTKHIFEKLEKNVPAQRRQLDRIVHKDFTNFFIGASPNEISDVLSEASDPEMRDGPYFSDEYAWYSMSMEPGFPKCTACKANGSVIHLTPIFSNTTSQEKLDKMLLKRSLMEMFYFDLTMNAIATVAKMKMAKTWIAPPLRICREIEAAPDDTYALPLFDNLKNSTISGNNLLGPFHMDEGKSVGKSHANFKMSINRLVFQKGQASSKSRKEIGIWTSGFGGKELILETDKDEDEWKAHLALPNKYTGK